jgi:hypothetical protein
LHVERKLSGKSIDNPTLSSCLFVGLGFIPDDLGHIGILGLFDEGGVVDALVVEFDTFLPIGSIAKRCRLAPCPFKPVMRRTIRLGVQTSATIMDRRAREVLGVALLVRRANRLSLDLAAAIIEGATLTRTFGCNSCAGKLRAIITSPAKLKPSI